MDPNIVILAGGASSRMRNAAPSSAGIDPACRAEALSKAKAMIGVGPDGRPFLDYLLYNIERAGYQNVLIVVGANDNSIRGHYEQEGKAGQFPGLRISYIVQSIPPGRMKPLGTADALLQALRGTPVWKDGRFTVCNSDNLYSETALRLLLHDGHENTMIDYDRLALRYDEQRLAQFAVILKDENGFLIDIVEKPSEEEMKQIRDARDRVGVSMNIWRFSYNRILPFLETVPMHPERGEKELPSAVKSMIAHHPLSVFAIPLSERVIDLTSQSDIPVVKDHVRTLRSPAP